MKKLFYFILVAILFAIGCSESFDDSKIWDKLDDHESRITQLEELCRQMNTNISSLQTLVNALNKNDYIKNVTPITESGEEIGYTITFTSGKTITIYHGKDGQDGQDGANGKDGQDGQDGSTPVIGVKLLDGIYYWTLNGEWLLDDNGNKIKAVGTDGKDGQDGNDGATGPQGPAGENGTDGKDGQNGADGKDGITPQLKIEDGKWYVSYDEGLSWKEVGQATGEQGPQGPQGAPGVGGDSMFTDIDYSTSSDYVVFTLSNGTEVKIPTWAAYEKLQTLCNQMNTNIASLQTIIDAMQNNDFVKSISPIMDNGKEIGYTIAFSKSGTITIYHGKDGQNGEAGATGQTPAISVKLFEGVYYWTVNDEWLLDDEGNKIKAQGTDGKDGQDGADGENGNDGATGPQGPQGPAGENGADGEDGQDGKDGITPQLKIEEGYWYISYDNGSSWTQLGKATGDKGEQGEQGPAGPQGATGAPGHSFFENVTQDDEYVYFFLTNGTRISVLKASVVSSIEMSYIPRYDDGKATLFYSSINNSNVEMDFQIMPKSAAAIIANDWQKNLSMKAVRVITRSVGYIDMPITACVADATNGTITITASGQNLPAKFFTGETKVHAALFYNTDIAGTVSEYVELVAKGSTAHMIVYTATEKVVPYKADGFGANIISNEWDETTGEGVITFDAGITKLGKESFMSCKALTSITIPKGITTIEGGVFYNCTNLQSISIPNSVTSMDGNNTFYGCNSLKSVVIPNSVTTLGSVFQNCKGLQNVTLSENLISITSSTFAQCVNLQSVTIPDGIKTIGSSAFNGCTSLTAITIPDSVTTIEASAFSGCSSMTKATIGSKITSIYLFAFNGCTSLQEIICKPTTPPTAKILPYSATWDAFKSISATAKIYVPTGSGDAYKAASGWKDYASIIEEKEM